MKTKILLIAAVLAIGTAAFSQTNSDTPPPAANTSQFTPDDIAKLDAGVNNLLPFIPAQERPLALKIIGLLGTLAFAGRVVVGWKNGGFWGAFHGIFSGTNPPGTTSQASRNLPPRAAGFILLALGLSAFMFTGCGGIPHQLVDNESGTGLKAKIPVGYNGNNIFEVDLTVGTFKHTSMIQPVETNRVFTPTMVVAATTRGKFTANAMNTSTNPTAGITGGDAYIITTGHAASSETNDTDITTEAWQDAPPSQAGK